MGLLLSILVVCVGVLEAVSCIRHIQDGYVPFWMPRRILPIVVEHVRRKPSIDHDDVSSSSEEEISKILVNPVGNANSRQESHGYGLTPILTEHRRHTPILFDEEAGDETIKYVENNIDECFPSSRRSSRDVFNHVVTEHFRPISPAEPEEEVPGSSSGEARELGATPAAVAVDQRCVSDESSETVSEFDIDNPQEAVLTYDDVQNNNQIGFRPTAPEPELISTHVEEIETCLSLDENAVQLNHIALSIDQQSEISYSNEFIDQPPDGRSFENASSSSKAEHSEEAEENKASSCENLSSTDVDSRAGTSNRVPSEPLLIDIPVGGGSSQPAAPSTPRRVKADISWPVFHPDAPVIKRPAVSSDFAARLGLSRDISIDEDLILDSDDDDVAVTSAGDDNLTHVSEKHSNEKPDLQQHDEIQPMDVEDTISLPDPVEHSFFIDQTESVDKSSPSLPFTVQASLPKSEVQENQHSNNSSFSSIEPSNISDTLPISSAIPSSNSSPPSIQEHDPSTFHTDDDIKVFLDESTRLETLTPVAITLEIDLPPSDLVNEMPDEERGADIPDKASPRITVGATDINIIENYFTTVTSHVEDQDTNIESTANGAITIPSHLDESVDIVNAEPTIESKTLDNQRSVSLKEILEPESKKEHSISEPENACIKTNISITSLQPPENVFPDEKSRQIDPPNKIKSDEIITVDDAPEHVITQTTEEFSRPVVSSTHSHTDEDLAEDSSESVSLGRDITSKESSIKRRKSYKEKKRSVTPKTSTGSIAEDPVANGVVNTLTQQVDTKESTLLKDEKNSNATISKDILTDDRMVFDTADASSNLSCTMEIQSFVKKIDVANDTSALEECRESGVSVNDERTVTNVDGKDEEVAPTPNDYDDGYMPDVVVHRRESAAEAILNKELRPLEVLHGSETSTEAGVYATKSHQERLQKRARAESVEEAPPPPPTRNTQIGAGKTGGARRTKGNETKPNDDGDEDQSSVDESESASSKQKAPAAFWLIFSGEYTKAMSKDWHSGHFCCWQCDESLTGQRYVLRDDHPYCIKCYESVFANMCEECNKTIGIDSKDLSYKDKHWHEACFLCNKCRVSLVDKQFGSKADKIYCGNCYDTQFASRCDGCGEIFRAGTKKMEYKTRQWHEKCFCCCVCKSAIGTKSFIPREQEIYCATCYEEKFATRCVKCNKIITSGGVTYKNEPWHRECFTCTHCNTSLAGQRFTSRDEKPYCAECFGELFAKRCTACVKPITGIGGTRFISFEDRHWHNDCFICASCKTSLVGRGFITDADDIICPECAKQKLM